MERGKILQILQQDIHTVIMATSDLQGKVYTCAIDLMLLENESLYFLTARGKSFYQRLMNNHYVALTGLKGEDTMSSIAISLQGKVKNIGHDKLALIFQENPYMQEIYPDEIARDVLEVFEIYQYDLEYFDLSQKPIYRQSFSVNQEKKEQGYFVNQQCVKCLKCVTVCPQNCININDERVTIVQDHCLHCGKCQEVCKYQAIDHID
ncbi:4Fe-4S binding protein [uncultured Thomasclavelia sp.]|uniref:4Fe-4S binding protein n=1 Tax=uncultured Thomasclavelia sp. TaxID=3025759 RepID=UPI0025DF1CB3|nr:4Fe-4S binding protein [uncultured Thomasclavelia sp.]